LFLRSDYLMDHWIVTTSVAAFPMMKMINNATSDSSRKITYLAELTWQPLKQPVLSV